MRDRLSPVRQPAGRQTQAVARSIHAARLAAIQDEAERERERDRGSYGPDYAGVSAFAEELAFLGFRVQEATNMAMANDELRDELERQRAQIEAVMSSPSGAASTPTWAQLANARAIVSGALVNVDILAERLRSRGEDEAERDRQAADRAELLEAVRPVPVWPIVRDFLTDGEHDRLYWAMAGLRGHVSPTGDDERDARSLVSFLSVGVENSVDKSGQPDEKSTGGT